MDGTYIGAFFAIWAIGFGMGLQYRLIYRAAHAA